MRTVMIETNDAKSFIILATISTLIQWSEKDFVQRVNFATFHVKKYSII